MTLKVCMQYQVLKYYQICSNDDPGLTLTYFTTQWNLVPCAFVWEKVKTMDFSETIVVYDIKVGRCSQLNENCTSTKGQGHSLTLVQNHSDSVFLNFFSSITADFNISSVLRWAIQDQWSSGLLISHIMRKPVFAICEQQRRRSACTSTESDQRLCYNLLR